MSLLEQFEPLRDTDPKVRLDAILKIFTLLDIPSKKVSSIDSLDSLKQKYGDDVHYTFTRLLRGLSSNRDAARLGFSGCLAELLRALPKIDVSFVVKQLVSITHSPGSASKPQVRDNRFGRLFGIQAIVSSDLLKRRKTTLEELREVVGVLYEMSMEKGWLRESCAHVVIRVLGSLESGLAIDPETSKQSKTKVKLCQDGVAMIHELLYTTELSHTIEGIAIAMKCLELGSLNADAIHDWGTDGILTDRNAMTIATIMKDGEATGDGSGPGTGSWKPRLHFAWMMVVQTLLSASPGTTMSFKEFWNNAVNDGLFALGSSHERRFHGVQLFNATLPLVDSSLYGSILTKNVVSTIANQSSKEDRFLHKAAKNALTTILGIAKEDTSKALPLIRALHLAGHESMFYFDRISKTKTCETLMEMLPKESMVDLVDALIDLPGTYEVSDAQEPNPSTDKHRQYIADLLANLIKTSEKKDSTWINRVLEYFTLSGFFRLEGETQASTSFLKSPFSDFAAKVSRDKIGIVFGALMSNENGVEYAIKIVHLLQSNLKNKAYELLLEPDEKIGSVLKQSFKNFKALSKSTNGTHASAFLFLYALAILQVYSGESDAVELLEDLERSYSALSSDGSSSSEDIQLLIDTLLAFLSKESAVVRKLVEMVFTQFATKLDRNSLDLLLNVLEAPESGEGLFDQDQAGSESSDDDSNDSDEDMEDDDDEDEDEDDDMSSTIDVSEDEKTEADKALDEALITALGTKRKSDDVDSDSEEDLLDDDAMMKMDSVLENIFKRRKQETAAVRKQVEKSQTQSTVHLKSKVLDLLEIFIKTCPESPMIINLIEPLMQLTQTSKEQQLVEKVQSLLRTKLTKSKSLPTTQDGIEPVLSLLSRTHVLALKCKTPPQLATVSTCSLFLSKIILVHDKKLVDRVCQVYTSTQIDWMKRKNVRLGPSFFTDFISWSTSWRQRK